MSGSGTTSPPATRELDPPLARIADEPPPAFADKVLALGAEVASLLAEVHAKGLAHGQLSAEMLVRKGDGSILLSETVGVTTDGRPATPDDDARALVALLVKLLPERTPEVTRTALQALAAEPEPARELVRKLNAIRAEVPIPKGRQIRSIRRLAFPPPTIPPKRSKRHLIRIVLTASVVGLGLWAAFGATTPATPPPTKPTSSRPAATQRPTDGSVFYVRLPPLPPKDANP